MKPHEETLEVPVEDARCVVRSGTGEVVADIREPLHLSGREFGRLFAAAPEMARAIMSEFGSFGGENDAEWHTNECWNAQQGRTRHPCARRCNNTRALLTRAGVLP